MRIMKTHFNGQKGYAFERICFSGVNSVIKSLCGIVGAHKLAFCKFAHIIKLSTNTQNIQANERNKRETLKALTTISQTALRSICYYVYKIEMEKTLKDY